jgi:dCMP deaminase
MKTNKEYMEMAIKASQNSNDEHTKVGCIIVSKEGYIVSRGHNRIIKDTLPKGRDGEWLNTKYPYVLHSEIDALNKVYHRNLLECASIYVTLFPCNNCMLALANAGIKKVYYMCDKYADKDFTIAAKIIAKECGIELEQVEVE